MSSDALVPAVESKKKANEQSVRTPELQAYYQNGVIPSTDIFGKAKPIIPSNLEAKNDTPSK